MILLFSPLRGRLPKGKKHHPALHFSNEDYISVVAVMILNHFGREANDVPETSSCGWTFATIESKRGGKQHGPE